MESVRDDSIDIGLASGRVVDWAISDGRIDYPTAVAVMERRIAAIAAGEAPELIWLLEHPALYTAGTSAKAVDLLMPDRFPVYQTGRGGQYTYHGPGQRVCYVMLDLRQRGRDVRSFVTLLERWLIAALAAFNVRGVVHPDRVGVWVPRPEHGIGKEDKIAAIGLRLRHWISYHGISLNVDPDLSHFAGIVPCGVTEHGVTSLADLGLTASMNDADLALAESFHRLIGPLRRVPPPV